MTLHPRRAFTLIEMLIVMAIIGLLLAMMLSVPASDRRRTAVEASARELAAAFRQARSLALERRTAYAVVFNITNAGGSSGRVLNNWEGGHWFQIMGPTQKTSLSLSFGAWHPVPQVTYNPSLGLNSILSEIDDDWQGERIHLPARKVRFLALTDQDNGHVHYEGYFNNIQRLYPTTYPRPWCGWYDPAAKVLYPWGGYDPSGSIKDAGNLACSGFYFQAPLSNATPIPDSRNPADRFSTIDGRKLLSAGQPRALVNGDWMDYYISFQPDGSVASPVFGNLRISSFAQRGRPTLGGAATGNGDLGDFAPNLTNADATLPYPYNRSLVANFARRTGYYYVTLAPDAEADSVAFPTAQAAAASMMPAYRVGVSQFGDVCIVPVRSALPSGRSLDTTIAPNQWQSTAVTDVYYKANELCNADGTQRGAPVTDALTPDMLSRRMWWLAP